MASFIPARSACVFDSNGERRFAERLDQKLNSDYLCWFNVPIGPRRLQPDFVIFHPAIGLLVLEVKDWRIDTIGAVDASHVELNLEAGVTHDNNPIAQARRYTLEAVNLLKQDPELCESEGRYKGNLLMPYGWGVVLPNITRKMFNEHQLSRVMNSEQVICQDEMTEAVSSEMFRQRLKAMFQQTFPCNLSSSQVDHVRYHLHPEVRIVSESGQFGLLTHEMAPLPSIIRVMDLQQEQLARSLGDGHRIIHGVAGSGKTMILLYRAQFLAKFAKKPVLVLCYNKTLASRLRQLLVQQYAVEPKVEVQHFHGWCGQLLKHQQLRVEAGPSEYHIRQVESVLSAVDLGLIASHQYSAILIDEAHDFKPDWFKLVLHTLESEAASLLVLYDDAQSIYNIKTTLAFTFSSVGIQARGRTTILKTNYRNTLEILMVAKQFAHSIFQEAEELPEDTVPTISPDSAGRRGDVPELHRFNSAREEVQYVVHRILQLLRQGEKANKIGVIYRFSWQAKNIEEALTKCGIDSVSTHNNHNKSHLYDGLPSVKIVSMPSSKGLEFDTVFILHLNCMPYPKVRVEDEARLLYVGMTRAVEHLVMTCYEESLFTQQVRQAIEVAESS